MKTNIPVGANTNANTLVIGDRSIKLTSKGLPDSRFLTKKERGVLNTLLKELEAKKEELQKEQFRKFISEFLTK